VEDVSVEDPPLEEAIAEIFTQADPATVDPATVDSVPDELEEPADRG